MLSPEWFDVNNSIHSTLNSMIKENEKPKTKKVEGKIQDNYDKFLSEHLIIGCNGKYPIREVIEEIYVTDVCRNYDVQFKVKYCKVSLYPDNDKCLFHAIITERVDIASKLPVGGFGSHCYIEEAEVMQRGVIAMAKHRNLMICRKENSWPIAEATVQDNFYKD